MNNTNNAQIQKGDIFYADLGETVGSEQSGIRPVLIIQNDVGNKYSPTVIAAAITSQQTKNNLPTHIKINASGCGLAKDSIVLLEQIRTIDKQRLKEKSEKSFSDLVFFCIFDQIYNTGNRMKPRGNHLCLFQENFIDDQFHKKQCQSNFLIQNVNIGNNT